MLLVLQTLSVRNPELNQPRQGSAFAPSRCYKASDQNPSLARSPTNEFARRQFFIYDGILGAWHQASGKPGTLGAQCIQVGSLSFSADATWCEYPLENCRFLSFTAFNACYLPFALLWVLRGNLAGQRGKQHSASSQQQRCCLHPPNFNVSFWQENQEDFPWLVDQPATLVSPGLCWTCSLRTPQQVPRKASIQAGPYPSPQSCVNIDSLLAFFDVNLLRTLTSLSAVPRLALLNLSGLNFN